MALPLYRRHRLECEAGRPEDTKSGEWEERRKGWKRCSCLIHLSGTLDGKYSRKATTTSDWLEARQVADALREGELVDRQACTSLGACPNGAARGELACVRSTLLLA